MCEWGFGRRLCCLEMRVTSDRRRGKYGDLLNVQQTGNDETHNAISSYPCINTVQCCKLKGIDETYHSVKSYVVYPRI